MGRDHGNGEQQLGHEIPVADGVDTVLRQRSEAEAALKQHARDGECTAGDRSSAERQHRRST